MPVDDVAARGFGAGAAAYESARPGYPDAAIALLADRGRHRRRAPRSATSRPAPASSPDGCSSSALASRPSSRSRRCAPRPRSRRPVPRTSTAPRRRSRSTDASVDVVTVAQAFHWFDAPAALAEIARVLRPDGRLAILWNERDESHRVGGGDEPDHPLARAHGVALPAHRLGRGRGGQRPLHAARTSGRSRGSSPSPARCSPTACGRSATSPPCPRSSASDTPPRSSRSSRAAPEPFPLPYLCRVQWCQRSLSDRQAAVLGWWDGQRRDLPWRQTRDPWEVLVCEVMAQQTQVARVAERWRPVPRPVPDARGAGRRRRPPRPSAGGPGSGTTAAPSPCTAPPGWSCATTAVGCPADLDALLALPGHRPLHGSRRARLRLRGRPRRSSTPTRRGCWPDGRVDASRAKEVQAAADAAVPAGRAWAWNQAMLDLGATVCTRRAPRCDACPVAAALRVGARRAVPTPDPADGSAGVSRWPVALRGQRPPGPRPPGRGAARRTGRDRRAAAGDGLARRRGRAPSASPRPSSPTASRPSRRRRFRAQLVTKSTMRSVHLVGLLDVEEVAGAVDDLEARALRREERRGAPRRSRRPCSRRCGRAGTAWAGRSGATRRPARRRAPGRRRRRRAWRGSSRGRRPGWRGRAARPSRGGGPRGRRSRATSPPTARR